MQPRAIHHVSINVPDIEAAFRFYTDVLGFTPRDDRPDFAFGGAWLDAGGQQLHLVEGDAPDAKGQHFAVLVDDLDATVAELRDRGVEVADPFPVGDGPARQTFLSDPAGNQIELHQTAP